MCPNTYFWLFPLQNEVERKHLLDQSLVVAVFLCVIEIFFFGCTLGTTSSPVLSNCICSAVKRIEGGNSRLCVLCKTTQNHKTMSPLQRQETRGSDALAVRPSDRIGSQKLAGIKLKSDSATLEASSHSSSMSLYIEDSPVMPVPRTVKLFLQCEDDDDQKCSAEEKRSSDTEPWQKQIIYWNKCVLARSVSLGPKHIRTAEALMDLGNAQLLAQECLEAGKTYLSALKIYQTQYGDLHLSVARALDKVGLAASMTHANLDLALSALTGALTIRCELLGPAHIDSVDSLNNIAGVRLNRREFAIAVENYKVVIRYRQRFFGHCHASVAVTAYKLACILSDQLDLDKESKKYFKLAQNTYQELGLTNSPYFKDTQIRLEELSSMHEI